jgi:hypothetical protein
MISSDDIQQLADRWKRATRPIRVQDQQYGLHLAEMIGKYNRKDFERFDEPLEAAAFIIFIRMVKDQGAKKEVS